MFLIRIDDYPTGVRPILPDHIARLGKVLSYFEDRAVPYLLGVVPALLTEDDYDYLRGLKHATIAMHGFDHLYGRWKEGDPDNEFLGLSWEETDRRVKDGLAALREWSPQIYIPPFNTVTDELLDSLYTRGFDAVCTSEYTGFQRFPSGSKMKEILTPTPLYGRTPGLVNVIRDNMEALLTGNYCIGLHVTWEDDEVVAGTSALTEFLDLVGPHTTSWKTIVNERRMPVPEPTGCEHAEPVEARGSHQPPSSSTIKILHITQQLSRGGAGRGLIGLAKYSARQGNFQHKAISIAPITDGVNAEGLEVLQAPSIGRIRSEIEAADIVQWHWWEDIPLMREKLPKHYALISCHTSGNRAPHQLTRHEIELADRIVMVCEYSRQLPAFQHIPQDKLSMIYMGADFERILPVEKIDHEGFTVGWIGTIDRNKFPIDYISVHNGIQVPGIKMLLVGIGERFQEVLDEVTSRALTDKFKFLGYRENMRNVLGRMDVYGFQLKPDTTAAAELNLQEVMVAGIPTVMLPIGGPRFMIEDGVSGIIAKDTKEYQQAIEHLYHNPEERAKMGDNAKKRALECFGAENAAKHYNELYLDICKSKSNLAKLSKVKQNQHTEPIQHAELVEARGQRSTKASGGPEVLVSAIVSTYNSEKYIRGCLDDLTNQTLYKKGELEIVVVNTGSEQNEYAIVEEYKRRYENITHIHIPERERMYAAWNRGIKAARGKYVTSANTDDRHRHDSLEKMAATLDSRPDIALVYADVRITDQENAAFDTARVIGRYQWLEFDRKTMFTACYMGPQPMWRRELHDRYGYFDPKFVSAGDYEFWLRMCLTETYLHIPETLGLYLKSPDSVEHVNQATAARETLTALERHWPDEWGPMPRRSSDKQGRHLDQEAQQADTMNRQAVVLAETGDTKAARSLLWEAMDIDPDYAPTYFNLAVLLSKEGRILEAANHACRATELDPSDAELIPLLKELQARLRAVKSPAKSKSKKPHPKGHSQTELDARIRRINACLAAAISSEQDSGLLDQESSVSLCMIVRDEEEFLDECLDSVKSHVREIIVVDTGSKDRTVEIAKSHGAMIHSFKWTGSYADARNEALNHATSEWVLFMDADERLDKSARFQIKRAVGASNVDAYDLTICNYLSDGNPPDIEVSKCCRLVRNKPEYRYRGRVHERIVPSIEAAHGSISELNAVIHHHGYKPELMARRNKREQYIIMLKAELKENPNDLYYLYHLGTALFNKQSYEEAIPYLEQAAEVVGREHRFAGLIYSRWSESLLVNKRNEEALAVVQRADGMLIRHPQLSHSKGNILRCLGRYQEALGAFTTAQQLGKQGMWEGDPSTCGFKADFGIAACYLALENYELAVEHASKALAAKPGNPTIKELLAQAESLASASPRSAVKAKPKLSLCMIVRDEERFIEDCLKSVEDIVDEIVVVDTGSTDQTPDIAKAHGAVVYPFTWNDSYAEARNEALDHANGEWILVLDADERIDPNSKHLIKKFIEKPTADAYTLQFRNVMSEGDAPDLTTHRVCRLFRNRPDFRYENRVHEHIENGVVRGGGMILPIDVLVHHYGYRTDVVKERGKHERYVRMLEIEVNEHPDDIFFLHHLTSALCAGQEFGKAVPYLEHATGIVAADNTFAPIMFSHLVNAHRELGRPDQGLKVAERAERLGVRYPQLSFCKANALLLLNCPKEAIAAFEDAIRMGRGKDWTGDAGTVGYKADFGLASGYFALEDYDKAIKYAESTLTQKPDNLAAHDLLANTYQRLNQPDNMEKHLRELRRLVPEDPGPVVRLAELYESQNRLADALVEYDLLARGGQENAALRVKMASLAEAAGDVGSAEQYFLRAVELKEDSPEAHSNFGAFLASRGRLEEALTHFARAVEVKPDYANAYFNAGDVLYSTANYQQAADIYQSGLQHNPNHAAAFFALGNCYCQLGAFEAAILAYKQALCVQPDYSDARANLALAEDMLQEQAAA